MREPQRLYAKKLLQKPSEMWTCGFKRYKEAKENERKSIIIRKNIVRRRDRDRNKRLQEEVDMGKH